METKKEKGSKRQHCIPNEGNKPKKLKSNYCGYLFFLFVILCFYRIPFAENILVQGKNKFYADKNITQFQSSIILQMLDGEQLDKQKLMELKKNKFYLKTVEQGKINISFIRLYKTINSIENKANRKAAINKKLVSMRNSVKLDLPRHNPNAKSKGDKK